MVANPATHQIEGFVSVCAGGVFKLDGHEGWFRFSKYAEPVAAMPHPSQRVRIGLDNRNFVRTLAIIPIDAEPPPDAPYREIGKPESTTVDSPPDKDAKIVRMNAITNAVGILSSGGRAVDVAEVLQVAAQFEAWVTRS